LRPAVVLSEVSRGACVLRQIASNLLFIVESDLFAAADLPQPSGEERKSPKG
jgi:hypothetical protein